MLTEPRTHRLKALGHSRGPFPRLWLEDGRIDALRRTGFPRRPWMEPGDRLVYYASVWRRVVEVVEVVEHPEEQPALASASPAAAERWPWSVAVEPLLVIPDLDLAPPVEAIGVAARSMSQQSHIRLTPERYATAVEAIASIAS